MNKNRPAYVGRLSLLCLLTGSLPWFVTPAIAETLEKLPSFEQNTTTESTLAAASNLTDKAPRESVPFPDKLPIENSNVAVLPIPSPQVNSLESNP
ncbi:MAG TPA: hypothetical protein V6D33_00020, partial [Cyanophyceae cyanobacterium]